MADIMLRASSQTQVTCVSNAFIDKYMRDANGEYVKIYLYLLRHFDEGQMLSTHVMAEALEHTQKDVMRALTYWEKEGLLHIEYNQSGEMCGICLLDPVADNKTVEDTPVTIEVMNTPSKAQQVERAKKVLDAVSLVAKIPEKRDYTPDEIETFALDEDVQEIFCVAESYLGHLTQTDLNTLLFWYDGLGFSAELAIYVIEYCVDRKHSSIHYMNKVAISWAEEGIKTTKEAQSKSAIYNQSTFSVMKAFGISNRNLIQSEIEFIDKWTNQYAFTLDIIQEACRRTIANTQKASFEYADKILTGWYDNGVHHLEDVEKEDKKYIPDSKKPSNASKPNPRVHNFEERDYDMALLEKKLLQ